MKKIINFILAASILIQAFTVYAAAAFTSSFETPVDIAYLVSAEDDETVIYDKNSTIRVHPAALVKIVTAVLVIEKFPDLSQTVTAKTEWIKRVEPFKVTTAGILYNEEMTVEQLLYCLLVYNANDAAEVLACHTAGSEEEFVKMMNDFAVRLGLKDTLFADPGGFTSGEQYSTARDLSVIFKYCMHNEKFSQIISTFVYSMPATNKYHEPRNLKNTNRLLDKAVPDYYYRYVKGGKSGDNADGSTNVVSLASKDGYSYICVVLQGKTKNCDGDDIDENSAFYASRALYDWVFEKIKLRTVAAPSTYVCEVKVRLSKVYDYVSLEPAETVDLLVPESVNGKSVLIEPIAELTKQTVDAPVKKGDILGRAAIKYADEKIAEVDLAAAFDVPLSKSAFILDFLLRILKSTVFRILLSAAALIGIFIFFIFIRNSRSKSRKRASQVKPRGENRR